MARPDDVHDPQLRGLMVAAREAYLGDRNRDSVEKSMEAFVELLRRQPDFLTAGPFAGNTRRVFPQQMGVTLKGGGTDAPEAVFDRDRFSNPEAITFFEYVSDCLVAAKL
jgi:hypothetical protein